MSWSIKLFRVKGIDVKVHLTFFLILLWAAYRWSGDTGAGLQGALFGVMATLLLFASVTLHEFGHSLQAKQYGVRVRDITLLPMGGVAQMDEIPDKPTQELRIALAGPLVNLALAAILAAVGVVLSLQAFVTLPELLASLGKASWEGMLAYLTMANLALGVFNLTPAFPMDGGRVLRALLALKLDYAKATAIAARIGQGLAFLLGLGGLATGSYTLVLIAVFVWMGAESEGSHVQIKSVLRDMRVAQAMTRQPLVLAADDRLARAVNLTLTTSQADFPVMENGSLVGWLSASDLLRGLDSGGTHIPVRQVMRQVPAAAPGDLLVDAQHKMARNRARAMPIVDRDGRVVGLLTDADINEAYRLLSLNKRIPPATSPA